MIDTYLLTYPLAHNQNQTQSKPEPFVPHTDRSAIKPREMNSFSSIERETATETAHHEFSEQLEFKDNSSNCYEESKGE